MKKCNKLGPYNVCVAGEIWFPFFYAGVFGVLKTPFLFLGSLRATIAAALASLEHGQMFCSRSRCAEEGDFPSTATWVLLAATD